MASTFQTLANQSPTFGQGVPAGYSDWRFIARLARPQTDAVLGTFILGSDTLSDVTWLDVTNELEWIDADIGASSAGGRISAGQMTVRLKNDQGTYSPWRSLYYGPGTFIQIGFVGASIGFSPLFTGITVSWNEFQDGNGSSRWIDIEALETMALLTEVNPLAISPIGAGENIVARSQRILSSANWQFNNVSSTGFSATLTSPAAAWTLQATALAQNALTDLSLAVDSVGVVVIPTRNGDLRLIDDRNTGLVDPTLATLGTDVPIVSDSITTANDDEQILGTISLARVGGTATTYTNAYINGRYQSRSTQRFDLIGQNPGGDADLARIANDRLLRGKNLYRVEHLELDTLHGGQVWKFIKGLQTFTLVNIYKPDPKNSGTLFTNYAVSGYSLHIEPLNEFAGIRITTSIETEPTQTATYAHITTASNTSGWGFET